MRWHDAALLHVRVRRIRSGYCEGFDRFVARKALVVEHKRQEAGGIALEVINDERRSH